MTKTIATTGRGAARRLAAVSVCAVALLAGACGGGAGEPSAEELGTLGARIYQQPDRADEILEEAGMTREQLTERVRAVAADVEASREYQAAFDREVGGAGS